MRLDIGNCAVVYLSFDEPRCEEFWTDLKNKVPWADRVHGVKGFDAAHKEAGRLAEARGKERVITVDGDNLTDPEFFWKSFEASDHYEASVFSWGGRNVVNGLIYGNGGLKCWPTDIIKNMRTHESSDEEGSKVDFCWDLNYYQVDETYSDVYPNGSPFQAFRAGFREGVKMSLDRGHRIRVRDFKHKLWWGNVQRLAIWCSVGADVENGLWCMYGARLGAYKTMFEDDFDHGLIADYDWFKSYWADDVAKRFKGRGVASEVCRYSDYHWSEKKLQKAVEELGTPLREGLGLAVAELDEYQSRFFKAVQNQIPRTGVMLAGVDDD